jgi:DNA mismatch repair ATPase MutS
MVLERFLKANLLQPLTDKTQIAERLDSIEELLDKQTYFEDISKILRAIPDTDQFISFVKNVTFIFIMKIFLAFEFQVYFNLT